MDYAAIKRTFDHYDKDHNGKITREEFMAIYSKHTSDGGKSTVDYFLKTYDSNRDGSISFDEFVLMMTGGKGLPKQAADRDILRFNPDFQAEAPTQPQHYTHQPMQVHHQEYKSPANQQAPVSGPTRAAPIAQQGQPKQIDPVKEHLPSTQHSFKLSPMGTPLAQAHLESKPVYVPMGNHSTGKGQVNAHGHHKDHLSAGSGQHQPRAPSPGDGPHCDKQVAKTAIEGLFAVAGAVQQSTGLKHHPVPGATKGKNPYL